MSENKFATFANSFQAIAKPGLENIRNLCDVLENPQNSLKFIHVAGTNGKGSVCAFLESMLIHAGFKTGKYTSPNLVRVNERICVNGEEIPEADLNRILEKIELACKKVEQTTGTCPTQFEIWTAAAFCYFKETDCDYVVLETGLGGEKDATNIVKTTVCAVLTHMALDHTEYLGNTLTDIGRAKAGIIKPECTVVSAPQEEEICRVIDQTCANLNCSLTYCKVPDADKHEEIYEFLEDTKLALGGINQIENAALAVACAKALGIDEESIVGGLTHAKHPARFEKLKSNLYYDGAHNPDGIEVLLKNIHRYFPGKSVSFVMATMADKDIASSLTLLKPHCQKLFTVMVSDNPRAMRAEDFANKAHSLGIDADAHASLTDAVKAAEQTADIVIICGSLYLYQDLVACRNDL